MKLVSFGGVTVNDGEGLQIGVSNAAQRSLRSNVSLETRRNRAPRVRGVEPEARTLTLSITPSESLLDDDPHLADYEAMVHWLFRRDGKPRVIVARRVPPAPVGDDPPPDTLIACEGIVQSLDPSPTERQTFLAEVLVPAGVWYAIGSPTTATASPIEVDGSAVAHPIVTLTSTATGTRNRITLTDRTRQGVIGWMQGIAWEHPASESWLWINGVPMPFRVDADNDRLWFRADIQADAPTLVDLYHIAGSSNTRYADQLDAAGTGLTAGLASGASVTADATTAGQNAVSASLTWQPGSTAAHHSGTPYTFGLSAPDTVRLVDRTATGRREQLGDDADSLVFTSPVEITNLSSFGVSVVSGYRLPEAAGDELDTSSYVTTRNTIEGPAVLRVKIGGILDASGLVAPAGDFNITGPPPPGSLTVSKHRKELGFSVDQSTTTITQQVYGPVDDPWPPQSSNLIFALAGSEGNAIRDSRAEFIIPISEDEDIALRARNASIHPDNVTTALKRAADGASVSYAGDWLWYVTFAEGSYGGQEIPLLSVTNTSDTAILVEQVWVDPVTLKPIVENRDAGTPANGEVRAVLRYRVRDDETWYTAWSQVVKGDRAQTPQAFTIPAQSWPDGVVQVAVGLESSANGSGAIDWGVLTVTSSPTMTLMSGQTPLAEVSEDISAMLLTGAVAFDVNDDGSVEYRIGCRGVFCDDGLEIDCADPWVEGDGNVGPVYGDVTFSDPSVWLALEPGDNTWTADGDIDEVSLAWRTMWSV